MKLFPIHKRPPPVKAWQVPITKVRFVEVTDDTWDLTLKKVIAHIDGIKDVRRIAHDADVALDLTKIALQHLLYYDSILMLDIFMFGNIYATTPEIKDFVSTRMVCKMNVLTTSTSMGLVWMTFILSAYSPHFVQVGV